MSESAIEFVENWVDEKIEKMDAAPADIEAQAKTLAAACIADAQNDGLTQADISDTFDDLAAFIAAEIEEAFESGDDSDEGYELVDDDDARLVDGKDDNKDDEKDDEKNS
jgi:hypothetical protein